MATPLPLQLRFCLPNEVERKTFGSFFVICVQYFNIYIYIYIRIRDSFTDPNPTQKPKADPDPDEILHAYNEK